MLLTAGIHLQEERPRRPRIYLGYCHNTGDFDAISQKLHRVWQSAFTRDNKFSIVTWITSVYPIFIHNLSSAGISRYEDVGSASKEKK